MQGTITSGYSLTLTSYNASGAADGGGTAFPAGTSSYITNQVDDLGLWWFQSDGSWGAYGYENGYLYLDSGGLIYAEAASGAQGWDFDPTTPSWELWSQQFSIDSDGVLQWGVSGTMDTNLYRSAANVLKTDDEFQAQGAIRIVGSGYGALQMGPLTGSRAVQDWGTGGADIFRTGAYDTGGTFHIATTFYPNITHYQGWVSPTLLNSWVNYGGLSRPPNTARTWMATFTSRGWSRTARRRAQ